MKTYKAREYHDRPLFSIELEDANFNGSEEGEKLGILQGARFLQGC